MRTLWVAGVILISTMVAAPVAAAPPSPLAEVQADCAQVTVTTSGWPEGSIATLGIGEMNGGPPINTTQTYPVKGNEWNNYYVNGLYWSLIVHSPEQPDQFTNGVIYCGAPVEPVFADMAEEQIQPLTFEPSVLFSGLELAPPW